VNEDVGDGSPAGPGGSGQIEPKTPRPTVRRSGIAASPGIAIGPAYLVGRHHVHVPHTHVSHEEAEHETKRFRRALKATHEQLEGIKGRLAHGEHRQILKAQQMMLRDPDLIDRTEALIRKEQINAEWAIARVMDEIEQTLDTAADEHFRERRSDVAFLGDRVLRNLLGSHPEVFHPPRGAVVVAYDLSPADTADLHRHQVAGIVTSVGAHTSHTAIMARSLEIPAVVGVEDVLEDVEPGDFVIVDAIHGAVVIRPGDPELAGLQAARDSYLAFEERVQKEHGLPAICRDGVHVVLRANVALEQEIESAIHHGAEGIGLYRTEYIFMNRDQRPSEEEHYRLAKSVLRSIAPYPVVFRTFDLGSDKPSKLTGFARAESNPAMGLRSLRLALRHRDMFLAQLRGLMRAALHGPLRIMLPLVSGIGELHAALACVAEAKAQLEQAGMAHAEEVPVGIMIEMPSAAITADLLTKHVDFMSIGTNDLIQYTLAIDRENEDVDYLYRPLHPAILRLVHHVVRSGLEANIPVSLCGEMAADPRYAWVLVGLGVRELSMHPAAIPVIKNIIRTSDTREMAALAERVLQADSSDEAERIVVREMEERFAEHLLHGGAPANAEDKTA